MTLLLGLALVSALVTFVASLAVLRLAHRFRLYPQKIRSRDVHTTPTPRLGGLAMFVGILAAIGVAFVIASRFPLLSVVFTDPMPVYAILGAALIIVVLGVADDLVDLDWMTKLAGQFVAAGLVAWLGVQIYSLPFGDLIVGSPVMSLIITVFTIVLVMNAINFIDGLDGLVAGVALIANGVFLVYSYLLSRETSPSNYFSLPSVLAAILVGACIGFLPLNWHPAKLFMGDTGAMLLGLLMAISAISVTGTIQPNPATFGRSDLLPAFIPIILPFAVLIVPLLDFALAVIRRLRAGKSPFSADRKHLHHRLLDMGHSKLHAVLIFYAWTAVVSIGCLLFYAADSRVGLTVLVVGLIACAVVTLAPLSRRKRGVVAAEAAEPLSIGAAGARLDLAETVGSGDDPSVVSPPPRALPVRDDGRPERREAS